MTRSLRLPFPSPVAVGYAWQDSEEREVVVYHERPMQLYLTPSAPVLRADAAGVYNAPAIDRPVGALVTADLLGPAEKSTR